MPLSGSGFSAASPGRCSSDEWARAAISFVSGVQGCSLASVRISTPRVTLVQEPRRSSEVFGHPAAENPRLYLPEFTATIGHAENPLMTPMNRANRSCRQWAYQVRLAMLFVRLTLVASIGLAPSVMRESRLTLPQDRLSASTCRPSRPISGRTLSQRIQKTYLYPLSLATYANYNRLSWRRSTRE